MLGGYKFNSKMDIDCYLFQFYTEIQEEEEEKESF